MWTGYVTLEQLMSANRWNVSYFIDATPSRPGVFPLRSIGELAIERGEATDPSLLGGALIKYIGLEHIRSDTGELVGFSERPANSVKSRSKIFGENDILFGRLRPELNKCFLARGEVREGICSTEFIVLRPDLSKVDPVYFRHVLASKYVRDVIHRFRSGAALPRVSASDFLSIEIPVPPADVQRQIARVLDRAFFKLVEMRISVDTLPQRMEAGLISLLETGGIDELLEIS